MPVIEVPATLELMIFGPLQRAQPADCLSVPPRRSPWGDWRATFPSAALWEAIPQFLKHARDVFLVAGVRRGAFGGKGFDPGGIGRGFLADGVERIHRGHRGGDVR